MPVATDTQPSREVSPLGSIAARCARIIEERGPRLQSLGVPEQPHDPEEGLWEDVSVPRAHAHRKAWVGSMRDAAHDEYLRYRFGHLDQAQKPKLLGDWLNSIVEAKRAKARSGTLNMIMPGNIGSGKTAAACALGNEAADSGVWALFVKHSTYLTWRRPDSAPNGWKAWEVRKRFVECELLVLDELCGEMDVNATEFTRRETIDLIDSRIAAGRPTAYTTNLHSRRTKERPAPGVAEILGERLLSRIESSAHLALIQGPDRRKPAEPLKW